MRGSLKSIRVIAVLKLLAGPTYVGNVRVFDPSPGTPEGAIYLERGKVVGARIGELVGRDALYRLLDAEGQYESVLCAIPDGERTLHHLSVARLDEFDRSRKTQWSLIQERIPSMDAVALPDPAFDQRLSKTFLPWQARALLYLDGTRSITELARLAQIDDISMCQLVLQLQDDGLLRKDVRLPDRYRGARVRLALASRRQGKLRLNETGKRLIEQFRAEDTLLTLAERVGVELTVAARATVDLAQQGAFEVLAGEADLKTLAGAA